MTSAAQAYLALPADERFETRISTTLKRHAETVAKAKGESLSEYVLEMLAEKVAMDIVATQELTLTPTEQVELLRILAAPAVGDAGARAGHGVGGHPVGRRIRSARHALGRVTETDDTNPNAAVVAADSS